METDIIDFLTSLIIPGLLTVLLVVVYYFALRLFAKQANDQKTSNFLRQITLGLIVFAGLVSILLSLPFNTSLKGQILGMVGIILSAAIALNSTTFLGNVFAGLMNKTSSHFKIGDFVYVGDEFGKISGINLFNIEIQTQDRGLITYPNIYIAANPIKVVRTSGTIISTVVSLGYDVSRKKIEKCLIDAATKAELKDPFVFIVELGDFSVSYKINGLFEDVSRILTARSKLNAMVLDELHHTKIEIVSPTFMNQRQLAKTEVFIPRKIKSTEEEKDTSAEEVLFDKAIKAEKIEEKEDELADLQEKIDAMKIFMKKSDSSEEKEGCKIQIEKWEKELNISKDEIVEDKGELDES